MMLERMMFPDTVEEFMDEYKIVDTDEVYTNGAALVPIFRMNQWFEHKKSEWTPIGTTPPGFGRYLVTKKTKMGDIQLAIGIYTDYGWTGNGNFDGVTAWMPLPEPYKEENDGR